MLSTPKHAAYRGWRSQGKFLEPDLLTVFQRSREARALLEHTQNTSAAQALVVCILVGVRVVHSSSPTHNNSIQCHWLHSAQTLHQARRRTQLSIALVIR